MSEGIRKVIQYDLWCAENAIDGLLNRKRRWQVSIPVQDDDTDVILSKPIGHTRHLLSEVERLTALLAETTADNERLRARVAELSLTAGEYRLLEAWRSGKWAELLALVSAKIAEEYEQ